MLDFNFNPHLDRPEATPVPLFGEIKLLLEDNGYLPTPITPGTKRPPHANWTDPTALTDELACKLFSATPGPQVGHEEVDVRLEPVPDMVHERYLLPYEFIVALVTVYKHAD